MNDKELLEALLQKAINFATEKHKGQKYGSKPYIIHSLAVLERVKKKTSLISIQCAAVLHDVVEDCGVTNREIEREFGHTVAEIVLFLTREQKESYADYIENIGDVSNGAKTVKIADLEENISNCISPKQKHLKDKYELALLYLEGR